ncbi:MAG: YhjD/YihY/BrkB family envelope integrity protein [Candidatus Brocadiia bacterium]
MVQWLRRARRFLLVDLWSDVPSRSRGEARGLHVVRVATLALRNFFSDRCTMRATALAYVTLLSLVPLLAFGFAVLKGLGVQERLKPVVLKWVAAGQHDVVERILDYIERTNVQALGAIGLLFLVWTTLKVLGTIERSFNEIWGVRRSRTWFRKFTDYVSVLVTAPILLLAAMSATTVLRSGVVERYLLLDLASEAALRVAPLAGAWVAFAAVYLFMPNTRVRVRSALVGGVVGGTAWHLCYWAYTTLQLGVGRYNAVYGTFAAVPIFMIWLYLSWALALLGAELAWASDHVVRYWEEQRAAAASYASREALALRAMATLAAAFQRDGGGLSTRDLADRLHAPSRLVADVLHVLVEHGLCVETLSDSAHAYQPARPLERITPGHVVGAMRGHGDAIALRPGGPEADAVAELIQACGDLKQMGLESLTFRDIAAQAGAGEQGPAAGTGP